MNLLIEEGPARQGWPRLDLHRGGLWGRGSHSREEGIRRELVRTLQETVERLLVNLAPPIVERVVRNIALERTEKIVLEGNRKVEIIPS